MTTVSTAHFNKAAQLQRNGKTEEAINELNLAIQLDSEDIKSYISLAAVYETRGQLQLAADLYKKALERDIDNPQTNLRLGMLLTTMGSYNAALTPLRMAWSNDKKNAYAANALAQALDASGDYGTAEVMYEEALRLNPGLFNAHYNLGTLCYNDGKYELAISNFTTYIARAGENSRAHRNIGKALARMGQLEKAVKSFNKAASLDPNDPTVYYNLALAYNLMENPRAAFDNYRQALKLYPNFTECRYTYAKALVFSGQVESAMSEFQTVLQQCPDHFRSLNGLATCCLKQQDNESAATLLRQAVDLSPEFAFAHYNLGIALRNLGYEYEAKHHFQEAARLDQSGQLGVRSQEPPRSARISNQSQALGCNMSRKLSSQF